MAFVRLLRHRRALCRRWRNHYNDSADHKGVKLHPFKSVDKSSQLACRLREGQGNEDADGHRETMFHGVSQDRRIALMKTFFNMLW